MTTDAVDAQFLPVEAGAVEKPLAIRNTQGMLFPAATPAERVAQMTELAQVFMATARRLDAEARKEKRPPLILSLTNNKGITSEHITVPLWRTLGAMLPTSITATTESTNEIPNGFEARAVLRTLDGTILGYADAQATRDENFGRGKPSNAIRSMAQTRAQGKAFRSVLDFLVVLAGFNPTPAEEMPKDDDPPATTTPEPAPVDPDELKRKRNHIWALVGDIEKLDPQSPTVAKWRDDTERHAIYDRLFKKHKLEDLSGAQLDVLIRMLAQRYDEAYAAAERR